MSSPFFPPSWPEEDKLIISTLPEYNNETRGPDLGWGQGVARGGRSGGRRCMWCRLDSEVQLGEGDKT